MFPLASTIDDKSQSNNNQNGPSINDNKTDVLLDQEVSSSSGWSQDGQSSEQSQQNDNNTTPNSNASQQSNGDNTTNDTTNTAINTNNNNNNSSSSSDDNNENSNQDEEEELPQANPLESGLYHNQVKYIFDNNKTDVSTSSIKQIIKMVQAIAKKPNDKKLRQLPMQGILIKKYVVGLKGGVELMHVIGFEELPVDNKPHLVLGDSESFECDNIATLLTEQCDYLTRQSTAPVAAVAATMLKTPLGRKTASIPSTPTTPSSAPVRCAAKGCSFFGSATNHGYCSVCFKLQTHLHPTPLSTNNSNSNNTTKSSTTCIMPGCQHKRVADPVKYQQTISANEAQRLAMIQEAKDKALKEKKALEAAASANDMTDEVATTPLPTPLLGPLRPTPTLPKKLLSGQSSDIRTLQQRAKQRDPAGCCASCIIGKTLHKHDKTPNDKLRLASVKLSVINEFNRVKRPTQHDRNRCFQCSRKLNLSGTECRCGYVFCGIHRYPQEHECRFDHYKLHTNTLERINTTVQHSKLENQDE